MYEDGFNFGYYCIIESMVHLIQRKIWSEVEHNQIRYESAEIICKYWYPEIEDDELQIITICMCALMYDNPGVVSLQLSFCRRLPLLGRSELRP